MLTENFCVPLTPLLESLLTIHSPKSGSSVLVLVGWLHNSLPTLSGSLQVAGCFKWDSQSKGPVIARLRLHCSIAQSESAAHNLLEYPPDSPSAGLGRSAPLVGLVATGMS